MGRVIIIGGTVVVAITVAVLMSSRFDVRYAPFESTSDRAAADVLVENQRLRSRVSFLEQQNGGLAAENEALQDEVNRLEVEGAGQGNLGQELTRERTEHDQTRRELAAERARAQELDDRVADLRAAGGRDSGNSGWFAFLVVTLLALAGAIMLWRRELWWRHRLPPPPMRVVGDGSTLAEPATTNVPSTRPRTRV